MSGSDADAPSELNVHPSRDPDLLTPDRINSDPPFAMRSYLDHFGNRVTRVEVPAGRSRFPIASSFMTRANRMKRRRTWR
jgi:hypothetical protein